MCVIVLFFVFLIKEHLLRLVLHDTHLGLYDKAIIPLHVIQSHCLAFEIHLLPFSSFVQCIVSIATCFTLLQNSTLLIDYRLFPSCWILLLPSSTQANLYSPFKTQHKSSLPLRSLLWQPQTALSPQHLRLWNIHLPNIKAVLNAVISRSLSQGLVILCFHGSFPYTVLTLLNICIPSAHQSGLHSVKGKCAVAKCTALECL